MSDQIPTPAPAPASPTSAPTPAPPSTVSATVSAAEKGDFSAFQDAEAARRRGTPKAPVEVPPSSPTPAAEASPHAQPEPQKAGEQPPATPLSKRQQDANERTRRAVEAATADLRRQLDEAQRALSQHRQPTQSQAQQPPSEPEWKRYAQMPDAPKVEDFERIEDHTAAMSHFVATKMLTEQRQSAQQAEHEAQRQRFLTERGQKYHERLTAAADADPDFLDKIPPAVASARPLSGCVRDPHGRLIDPGTGQPASFANVAAEAAFRSENPDALLKHLHAHQADTVAIARLPQHEWLPALIHLDGRLSGAPSSPAAPAAPAQAPSAPPPSPISAAPPPPPQLQRAGSAPDPKQAALERGDFAAMQTLWSSEKRGRKATA